MILQRFALGLLLFLTACTPTLQTQSDTTPLPATTIVSSTPLPESTMVESPPPLPTTPTPVALIDTIGQPIQGGIIAFTLNELNATMGAGRGDAPRGGHFYLVANITIQNTSSTENATYDSGNLSLIAPDGTTYLPIRVDVEPRLESGSLNAGESVTANAVFEVPDTASELVLRYLYHVNDPPIQLNLGLLPAPFPGVE